MNAYELILLFDPALGEEKIGQVVAKIEEKIKSLGAEVEKVEKWGTKKLASRVRRAKKLTQGYYVLIYFRGESRLPEELIAYLRVTEHVIRYFVARAEEFLATPKEEKEIAGVPLEVEEIKEEAGLGQF
jgi:small subunit ribosomal protein S6